MNRAVGESVRALDPRLKMVVAFVLGPSLWALSPVAVVCVALVLIALVVALSKTQPLGPNMVRSLFFFTAFWVGIKVVLDIATGMPTTDVLLDGGELAVRLIALLVLGLGLALSTSARSLGLAVSWILRPLVGGERAWKIALSLALMVHFLPICLATMTQVRETLARRCPASGLRQQLTVVPLAVIRNLGQKTWNQTLAVAGRGLENGQAWEPDFQWTQRDSGCFIGCMLIAVALYCI